MVVCISPVASEGVMV